MIKTQYVYVQFPMMNVFIIYCKHKLIKKQGKETQRKKINDLESMWNNKTIMSKIFSENRIKQLTTVKIIKIY